MHSDIEFTVLLSAAAHTLSAEAKVLPGGNVELWGMLVVTLMVMVKKQQNVDEVPGAGVPQL